MRLHDETRWEAMVITKQFSLRTILTVTTGRLLTEPRGPQDNGIGDLYELLNWTTGDDLFTHQLPRASEAVKPWLLKCFPELAGATMAVNRLDEWLAKDRTNGQEALKMWLAEIKMMFPALKDSYDVPAIPEGRTHVDPLLEAEAMLGREKVIAVTTHDN